MDETLIKKLTAIVESQKQLEDDLSKVDISSDPNKYAEMAKIKYELRNKNLILK